LQSRILALSIVELNTNFHQHLEFGIASNFDLEEPGAYLDMIVSGMGDWLGTQLKFGGNLGITGEQKVRLEGLEPPTF